MKSRAERRHDDWTKAIRKRNIDRDLQSSLFCYDWYDNLHQYSKNKIHCSCPLCAAKTSNKGWYAYYGGGTKNWKISDRRKMDEMDYDEEFDFD